MSLNHSLLVFHDVLESLLLLESVDFEALEDLSFTLLGCFLLALLEIVEARRNPLVLVSDLFFQGRVTSLGLQILHADPFDVLIQSLVQVAHLVLN